MAVVKIADVVVPEFFTGYAQQITTVKSELIQSGLAPRVTLIDQFLEGGGNVTNIPSWQDLANVADNVSSDDDTTNSTAQKTTTSQEIVTRLSRNQSWSAMDLASDLAGSDALGSIGSRVGYYWTQRLQAVFISTLNGSFRPAKTKRR